MPNKIYGDRPPDFARDVSFPRGLCVTASTMEQKKRNFIVLTLIARVVYLSV
ncbi:MAG: hypothetical protein CM15mP125_0550 [Gammaproteobacteria bacterium]|nr:MAG: hypothetical protein CM15mP125_0550 [Gammaproteobacteria bacterium]